MITQLENGEVELSPQEIIITLPDTITKDKAYAIFGKARLLREPNSDIRYYEEEILYSSMTEDDELSPEYMLEGVTEFKDDDMVKVLKASRLPIEELGMEEFGRLLRKVLGDAYKLVQLTEVEKMVRQTTDNDTLVLDGGKVI